MKWIWVWAIAAGLAALGCDSIATAVGDECSSKRRSYELAANKVTGLKQRNVAPGSPVLQRALEERRRAGEVLAACAAE